MMNRIVEDVPLAPGPLTGSHALSREHRDQIQSELVRAGVRLIPYPFGSAVAVVSDLDGTTRSRFESYVGILVRQLGLDFGDSTFLQTSSARTRDGTYRAREFGLLSMDLKAHSREGAEFFTSTRTFAENMVQFHAGNIDHLHALLSRGPRVALLPVVRVTDGRLWLPLETVNMQWPFSCEDFFVHAICVTTALDSPALPMAVEARGLDNHPIGSFRKVHFPDCGDGRRRTLFVVDAGVESGEPVANIVDVRGVTVTFNSAETGAEHVEQVLLLSAFGPALVDRLKWLNDICNVELPLVTEHAAMHFRNPPAGRKNDMATEEGFRAARAGAPQTVFAVNGCLRGERGELIFSTDADDPCSFCRVLPDMAHDGELRFVVPEASSGITGWSPLDLVTPTPTRSGGALYWARRVCPNIEAPPPGRKRDTTRTQHDTFVKRMGLIVEAAAAEPGRCWPLYTHIGGGAALEAHGEPTPYFELGPLLDLQNRVFNISGKVPERARLWFCRASTIYDYALMIRSIAPHVERPDANHVRIKSWFDNVLKKRMPRGPTQLYGLTFYVDEPQNAEVWLDDRRIDTITRNPADETGRPSITIAESGIKWTIFDRLDPLRNQPEAGAAAIGAWTWCEAGAPEKPHGRLSVPQMAGGSSVGEARITFGLHGLQADGAQHLAFSLRRDPEVTWAVVLQTLEGARFVFGDGELLDAFEGEITAHYGFEQHDRSAGAWQVFVAPFRDMRWSRTAAGGPLPSNPLSSVTIMCRGGSGRGIDIGQMVLLRPRAYSEDAGKRTDFVVCGRVEPFEAKQLVHLAPADAPVARQPRSVDVDQRGYFCIPAVPAGLYRLWSKLGGAVMYDRRGPLVDVGANVADLLLCRPPGRVG
jgi:hypothetical protein